MSLEASECTQEIDWWPLLQELAAGRSQQQHVAHLRYAGEHDVQVQPPIRVVHGSRTLIVAGTVDDATGTERLPLRGGAGEETLVGELEPDAPDGVVAAAGPRERCFRWLQEEHCSRQMLGYGGCTMFVRTTLQNTAGEFVHASELHAAILSWYSDLQIGCLLLTVWVVLHGRS